jgi:P27 family predicted phage terminase small subunit
MDLEPPPELDALPIPGKWEPKDQEKLRSDRSREMWVAVVRKLIQLERITELDRPALIRLCLTYGSLCVARTDIALRGIVVMMPSKTGTYPQQNPSVAVEKSCDDRLRRWFSLFGLVPAARQKLRPAEIVIPKLEAAKGLKGFLTRSSEAIEKSDAKAAAAVARKPRKAVKPTKKPARKAAKGTKTRGR